MAILQPVTGNRFTIAMAQRFDILIDLPKTGAFPISCAIRGRPPADRNHSFDAGCANFADDR